MKILELRFKNLNSLYGEWCIDFTDPAFTEDGLFAITGPTGSGKTTVLDAICLALYGQTPRLGKMTQSDNEVMSRQTGECSAEVLFETASGTYRAAWHQHRSRKKADGALQAPKRDVADSKGTLLAEKRTDVQKKIDELTGMSFDRFTRSILLAQGSFDTFLKANADERSPILEQITGTEIYTEISKAVHLRNSEENQTLKELTAALGGIQLLNEEELEQIVFNKKNVEEKHRAEAEKRDAAKAALDCRDRIHKLEQELEINCREKATWAEAHKAFQPEDEKLTASRHAQPLDVSHVKLVNLRNSRTKTEDELAQMLKTLPALEELYLKAEAGLKQSDVQLKEKEAEQQKWAPVLKQVRELDTQISIRSSALHKEKTKLAEEEAELEALRKKEKTNQTELEHLQQKLCDARIYQEKHAQDAELVGQLAAILQSLKHRGNLASEKLEAESAVIKAESAAKTAAESAQKETGKLATAQKQCADSETALNKIQDELEALLAEKTAMAWRARLEELRKRFIIEQQISEARETIDKKTSEAGDAEKELAAKRTEQVALQREQRLLLENLQLQEKLKSLEHHRNELIDGKPCPLCGSLQHPFATHLPKPETRSIDKVNDELTVLSEWINQLTGKKSAAESMIENHQASLKKNQSELHLLAIGTPEEADEIEKRIVTIEKMETMQTAAKTALEQACDALHQQKLSQQTAEQTAQAEADKFKVTRIRQSEISTAFKDAEIDILQSLAPYGMNDLDQAADQLTARRDQWLKAEEQQTSLKETLATLKTTLAGQTELLKTQGFRHFEHTEQLKEQTTEINGLKADRNELVGDQQTDTIEQDIERALLTARNENDAAKTRLSEQKQTLSLAKQTIDSLKKAQKENKEQLSKAEPVFIEKLNTAGFDHETAYLSARLSDAEQAELEKRSDELKQRHTHLMALETEKTKQLQAERAQKHIETSPEEHTVLVETCNALQQEIGTFNNQIKANDQAKAFHAEKLDGIEKQKTECNRWNTLHELIGSADGKKFRNFAQGLTFELMVSQANRQLTKMSDRYLLIRDINQPLDLNVVDNYQAGEIRPVKNLSGGESFIVSLSLALGLSKMASHTIRVDSLFLDEGFGTLDEDALETALEALAELKQDGKIIGVISHVGALKERIGTQINLHTGSGGRSRLSGAGVSQTTK